MLKRRRALVLRAAVLVAVVSVVIVGIGLDIGLRTPEHKRPDLAHDLAAAVEEAGAGGIVRLTDIASFGWTDAHVLFPYACASELQDALGFAWSPVGPIVDYVLAYCVLDSEEEYLLAFVDREAQSVVAWTYTEIAERAVLFDVELWPSVSLSRSDACLEVVRLDDRPPRPTATVQPVDCP